MFAIDRKMASLVHNDHIDMVGTDSNDHITPTDAYCIWPVQCHVGHTSMVSLHRTDTAPTKDHTRIGPRDMVGETTERASDHIRRRAVDLAGFA